MTQGTSDIPLTRDIPFSKVAFQGDCNEGTTMKRQEDFEEFFYQESKREQSDLADTVRKGVQKPPRCANCDIDILWPPTVVQEKTFCCIGCASGGPCCCDYSQYRSMNISGVIHYGLDEEAPKKSSD